MCWANLSTQTDGLEPGAERMGSWETDTAGSVASHLVGGPKHIITGTQHSLRRWGQRVEQRQLKEKQVTVLSDACRTPKWWLEDARRIRGEKKQNLVGGLGVGKCLKIDETQNSGQGYLGRNSEV